MRRLRCRVDARLLSAAILLLPLASACTDAFAPRPNTDVGLYVWGEVEPASLSIRDSTTEIRIRVYVRNPSGSEIRVISGGPPFIFTGDPAGSTGLWGSYRVVCAGKPLNCGPTTDWFGDSVYVFPAHETVYNGNTFTLKEWGGVAVRAYHVRVWFNAREGQSATLNITP